ncbi:hypothetical protein FHR24_001466 [Wenyingzhuangia heitensis]|uniref:Uncharacterized protein n=1 Tax=Wenyingzhuangia heitensis TaxID=1487859 RepID=A0ABX0U882_9FLAO|nr:hypothetical protein [Wenyingzhuangia heitensis]NIJ45027.1 hypothetical protein [Wenyingzhuangia heitensis]
MIERILALDSLVNVLTLKERMWLQSQRCLKGFLLIEAPSMVIVLKSFVVKYDWQPPERKYNEDRAEIWLNQTTKEWQPIEMYKHKIINEVINQIPVKK